MTYNVTAMSQSMANRKSDDGSKDGSIYKLNDHSIMGNVGRIFTISDKLLGHGSYGDVFLAKDETGKELAVKCCDMDKTGIPNILESSIMASVIHPCLNKALRIQASDTKLYIIQEKAKTDLSQYTRRDRTNYKPSIDELRNWCFSISQAVAALHRGNIIHADIKASNILLYDDGSIKLTDFTLATKKWSENEKFTHHVCTCTHRPLECLLKKPWNESLDIWSLGCTFYEIAYGELLFPYQGSLEKIRAKDKNSKIRLKERSINAIIDWAKRLNSNSSYEPINVDPCPIDYIKYSLCSDYDNPEMQTFNDLICKMLVIVPENRLTIFQVLSHPFFNGMKCHTYMSITRPINNIPVAEHARVSRYIQCNSSNEKVQALALNIYRRCNNLNTVSEQIKAIVCTWISSKIVLGYPPEIRTLQLHQILSAERDICHNLNFRLHVL